MNKKKLLSYILAICMVMSLAPTIAYASGEGASINVTVKDNSVDASSINVEVFVIIRDGETKEDDSPLRITIISPENVTVSNFETAKTDAIEEAKTRLNAWLETTREEKPDKQYTVVGDVAVEGEKVSFDNRTYTMHGPPGTSSRYMKVDGDYGHTGSYTVTLIVETQDVGGTQSNTASDGESDTDHPDLATQQADHNSNLWFWFVVLFGVLVLILILGTAVYRKKLNK